MARKKNAAPTMNDVALEAGVALGTVSKVVNGLPVGEKYRKRVEDAIEKLDYHVSYYARGLRTNKTNVVAVMLPNLVSPYFAKLADAISRELAKRKCRMLFLSSDFNPEVEQELVTLAEYQRVDGIISLSYKPDLTVSSDIPWVSIDRGMDNGVVCVCSDNYSGGRLAAQKLIENGCRNLAFMRIGSTVNNEPNKRKDGFISGCEEAGVSYTVKIGDDYTPYSEFEDFLKEHFHDGKLDFDGIFCVTDSFAYQTVQSLTNMGVRVPEDVQIIGFDGIRHFGDMDLVCSTIVQPIEAIAATSVEVLLDHDGKNPATLICLPVQYAYGGTTKN